MEKPYFARFGQKSLDSFAPCLFGLNEYKMRCTVFLELKPSESYIKSPLVKHCHKMTETIATSNLVDNESEPETDYSGLGTGAGVFSVNVMSFGDVVYGILDLEFDDIGYFGSREEAEEVAEFN